jgi:hypothetical protein
MTANVELPRISVSRSITRKVGENYEKVIFSAEKSLAITQPIEAGLAELNCGTRNKRNSDRA